MSDDYNTSNRRKQGGDVWEVGGELKMLSGSTLTDERFSASAAVAADVLVIPVTASYVAKTTGGDAEALSLANGVPGQILTINLTTDGGGTGTLTPATCSGFATIAFADAGDNVTLRYIDDTVGWVLMGASGATAQPVIALS